VAGLSVIRTGLRDLFTTEIPELFVYDTVEDVVQLDALVIAPDEAHFTKAMRRGHDEWRFNLYLLVPRQPADVSQARLDQYVTGAGSKSIRQIVYGADGFVEGTSGVVTRMRGYGGSFEHNGVPHIGAVLSLTVITPGSE
jgi:hypothetical protein